MQKVILAILAAAIRDGNTCTATINASGVIFTAEQCHLINTGAESFALTSNGTPIGQVVIAPEEADKISATYTQGFYSIIIGGLSMTFDLAKSDPFATTGARQPQAAFN